MERKLVRTAGKGILTGTAFFVLFLMILAAPAALRAETRVEVFSPQGTVKEVRQAAARFSAPMVPFGDLRLADPFDIVCPEAGKGRWVDGRNWVYDFDRELPAGVRCEFRLREGLKSLAGEAVAGPGTFAFSTGGPAVVRSRPWEGDDGIDEHQIFILYLDAPAREESILEHVCFAVQGVGERIGIRIVTGRERDEILATTRDTDDPDRMVLIQARQSFPPKAQVSLVWGAGIAAASGVATEQDQTLAFTVRDSFAASFSCSRERPERGCIPVLPMSVTFSAPVPRGLAEKITLTAAGGRTYAPQADKDRQDGATTFVSFPGPFPEKTAFSLAMPAGMQDDAGRGLANRDVFPLAVRTDVNPPLAKFASRFGLIELASPVLPVTVRDIEATMKTRRHDVTAGKAGAAAGKGGQKAPAASAIATKEQEASDAGLRGKMQRVAPDREGRIIAWLQALDETDRRASVFRRGDAKVFTLPKPGGRKAFEVMGIPLPGAGFYVVELESRLLGERLLGKAAPMYVPTAALVTNMAAHFQWGRESSLVWVTTLDAGLPVAGAQVSVRNCRGDVLWQGKTDADGIVRIAARLPAENALPECRRENVKERDRDWRDFEYSSVLGGMRGGLFVFARTSSDMTFTHSSWKEGIEPWRFQIPTEPEGEGEGGTAHTIFDRPLFRAGETVHMKHLLRRTTTAGFAPVRAGDRPDEVSIEHEGSNTQYRFPLSWHENGSALTDWPIPEGAKLGTYRVVLGKKKKDADAAVQRWNRYDRSWYGGSFGIEEYRVPLMRGIVQGPAAPLVRPASVDLDLAVSYLSGGAAAFLPVRLRGEVRERSVAFPDYDGYVFTGRPLKEGITATDRDEEEGPPEGETDEEMETSPRAGRIGPQRLPTRDLVLDAAGALRTTLAGLPKSERPRTLRAEMEYRDPNGEVQTAAADIPLHAARRVVGIRPDAWNVAQDALKYRVAVLDLQGRPLPGADVAVDLYQEIFHSHRVRLVGGFYAYRHTREIRKIGRHAAGRTDAKGLLLCEGPSPVSGNVIIHARTQDEEGNVALADHTVWIAGKDDWWFEAGKDDRIDVLPERKQYEPGETARFQVRMPFREATALVTVAREGIIETFVRNLSGKAPLVEVPVKGTYAPNVYVSVLCVRGRVGDGKPTAMFDPGRPAYKIGIGEIAVGWKAHALNVAVQPDKQVYKIRETMEVRIAAAPAGGGAIPKHAEAAVAAVDEGLLELRPNESWDILTAMMGRRPCEVRTATAQAMVVGKRHFGLKAKAQGGGGGRQITRQLFDTLLLWQGRVALDEKGEGTVKIPLNDSLTSFRIVAVATARTDLFGKGEAVVRTTQDLMLLSGVPPLAREGDRFPASFTARNTTDRAMDVEVTATVSDGRGGKIGAAAAPVLVHLPAGQAREIPWTVAVPAGAETLVYEVAARERGGDGSDTLKVTQKIVPAVPVRTWQATLAQVREPLRIEVARPADALPERGGISVQVRPRIGASLAGVREYMLRYPYSCLEQKVSRAVALRDHALWKETARKMPAYLDEDGLLRYFPSPLCDGSDVLTAYVLTIAREAGWELPDVVRTRGLAALRGFVEGRIVRRGALPTADLSIRKLAVIAALSRYEAVSSALLASFAVEPNLWPTSALLDWIQVLERIENLPDRDKRRAEARQILRSRLNLQGTTMNFTTERMDALWWLMTSVDQNAVRVVHAMLSDAAWQEDLPRLVRGALGRLRQGHWDTTTANAWGVLALEAFSRKFEAVPVAGSLAAQLAGTTKTVAWAREPEGGERSFPWPRGKKTLTVIQSGQGAPWAVILSRAAIPLKAPVSSGYAIRKKLVPVEQKVKGTWSRGDVVRVRLEMDAQADMTWVVVSDPVPAGATILRTDLGGGAQIVTAGERSAGMAWEAFTERSAEAFRSYYIYVPKGTWSVAYTLRLNNEGRFLLPTTRVEALYAPEMFGEIPNGEIAVKP